MNKYYLAVPVGEGFPEHSGRYKCIDKDGEAHTMNFNRGNNFFHWPVSGLKTGKDFITHWLEPREGVLLQREELEEIKQTILFALRSKDVWMFGETVHPEHENEAEAMGTMHSMFNQLMEKLNSLTSKTEVK